MSNSLSLYNEFFNVLEVIPRSIEPQHVNSLQEPVFTLRIRNRTPENMDVSDETILWLSDNPNSPQRGFHTKLESPVTIAANSEAILRFNPVRVSIPEINAGSYPIRLSIFVKRERKVEEVVIVSPENSVRIDGSSGKNPVEEIAMGIQPGETLILSRERGFKLFSVSMKDQFPVNLRVELNNANPQWPMISDDGINLTTDGRMTLRQVRAATRFGIWVVPPDDYPANTTAIIGALTVRRCPLEKGNGGVGFCIGVGGRLRAVIAESAAILLSDLKVESLGRTIAPGEEFTIQGTMTNPFQYRVTCRGPAGAVTFYKGADVSNRIEFETLNHEKLEPGRSSNLHWKFRVSGAASEGIYSVYPFVKSEVKFSRPAWAALPPLSEMINKSDPTFDLGVKIEIRRP